MSEGYKYPADAYTSLTKLNIQGVQVLDLSGGALIESQLQPHRYSFQENTLFVEGEILEIVPSTPLEQISADIDNRQSFLHRLSTREGNINRYFLMMPGSGHPSITAIVLTIPEYTGPEFSPRENVSAELIQSYRDYALDLRNRIEFARLGTEIFEQVSYMMAQGQIPADDTLLKDLFFQTLLNPVRRLGGVKPKETSPLNAPLNPDEITYAKKINHDVTARLQGVMAYAEAVNKIQFTGKNIHTDTDYFQIFKDFLFADEVTYLLEGLEDITHIRPPKFEEVDGIEGIGKIAREIAGFFKAPAEKGNIDITVETYAPAEQILTVIDKIQISRAITNIFTNSVRATLESHNKHPQGEKGKVSMLVYADSDQNIHIVISDNGPGIPASVAGRMFEEKQQGEHKGSEGLGLSISKEIIEATHHGRITGRSVKDGQEISFDSHGDISVRPSSKPSGTSFDIMLPRLTFQGAIH